MPSLKLHKEIEKKVLGYALPEVDKIIDSMWWVDPKNHREWFHNPKLPLLLYLVGKEKVAKVAFLHILLDSIQDKKLIKSLV